MNINAGSAPELSAFEDPKTTAQKRRMAELLMQAGTDASSVGHWTQALARVLQGGIGGYQMRKADAAERAAQADANASLLGLLGPATGGPSPAGMPPTQAVMQEQDALNMTPEQKGVANFAQGLQSPGFASAMESHQPQIDPSLVEGVKGFEGYAAKAYPDYKQYSVGYGTRATSPNEVIDKAEAERRLQTELGKAKSIVQAFAPNAPPGVQNALTSLTYNAGDKWTRSGLGALVKAGDYQGAQQRLLQYNKAGGVTNTGLVKRRAAEAQWMGGQQPAPVQVADASGQTVGSPQSGGLDREALAKMMANPYTRDFAQKLILQQYVKQPVSALDQAKIDYYKAQTAKTQNTQAKPVFTPGEQALDKAWAKTYEEDIASGKLSDALSQLSVLKSIAGRLNGPDAPNVSGAVLGMVPESVRAYTNPESVDIQNQIANIVQRSLRPILGAQFTEKEGENLIKRAYNPQLDEATNAKRLTRLADIAEKMAQQKLAAAQYFEQNGTLKGFKGSANFSLSDVENAIDAMDTSTPKTTSPEIGKFKVEFH